MTRSMVELMPMICEEVVAFDTINGNQGDDEITGNAGDDNISGGPRDDVLEEATATMC